MAKCGHENISGGACPFDALPESEYCYWHQEIDGKTPSEMQLNELKGKQIWGAYLKGANLFGAKLQGANLFGAELQGANLTGAELQGAHLWGAVFDAKSRLDDAELTGANLYRSYVDEAKSFRYATFFQNHDTREKETNEQTADSLGNMRHWHEKTIMFGLGKIEKEDRKLASDLQKAGLKRYAADSELIFYSDIISHSEEYPDSGIKERLDELIFETKPQGKKQRLEKYIFNILGKDYSIVKEDFLYKNRAELYNASYEVYNMLYNFYSANGDLRKATHAHYRRGEAYRKLLLARGGKKTNCEHGFLTGSL